MKAGCVFILKQFKPLVPHYFLHTTVKSFLKPQKTHDPALQEFRVFKKQHRKILSR